MSNTQSKSATNETPIDRVYQLLIGLSKPLLMVVHTKDRKPQAARLNRLINLKFARSKLARMLAVTGEILISQLGFSFPVGLVRLPVVGGLFP